MNDKYIGKLLDNRYEILQVIGTGGMAVVYKALCHRLNRHVAIKILKDEYAKDEGFRNRFHAESHAVAMLSHPNIVAVYDVSRSNSIEYIVMELIDGMTLKQYIERRGTLSQKESIHFVTQILKALSHAHSKGIIHRDIKPHNIMLLRDSTVKVADFGIARFESSQRTVTREAFGSVHYIAPEQAKGSHIDCRADIYSTGVVLYEMLTGRLPYEGDTPVSVALQHISSLPLSPREINPEIPEALERITMKAMSPTLSKRYTSTDEMLADLEEYRKNPHVNITYEPPVQNEQIDTDDTKKIGPELTEDIEEEFEESNPFKAKMPLIAAIIACVVFVAGVLTLAGTLFGWGTKKPSETLATPNIIGMTLAEAQEQYSEFKITEIDESTREFSDEYDAGEIVRQSPQQGESNSSGNIRVTISKGRNTSVKKLSDLADMSREQAEMMLDRDGLKYKILTENSDDIVEGNVIRTVPEAGSDISADDIVTLYISIGKLNKDTIVPNLLGLTEEKAIQSLEASKLEKGEIKYENSAVVSKGNVISQDLNSGDTCSEGTAVGFTVSLGAKNAEISDKPAEVDTPKDDEPDKPSTTGDKIKMVKNIRLPSDLESFTVKITVNGETQYEEIHKGTDGAVDVTLSGKGESTICVYINDELRQEIPMIFE